MRGYSLHRTLSPQSFHIAQPIHFVTIRRTARSCLHGQVSTRYLDLKREVAAAFHERESGLKVHQEICNAKGWDVGLK